MAICIRLPNWLGDVAMALPVVRAIAAKNPDITLLGLPMYRTLLPALGVHFAYRALPAKDWRYYGYFWRARGQFRQTVLFANSQRSDLEAWLAGIPERYGIAWRARPRRLLNHTYRIADPEKDATRHQTQLWTDFTAHFVLQDGVSLAPLGERSEAKHIVLICGSENTPEKRWPVAHWRALIEQLMLQTSLPILLSGTASDSTLTTEIAQGFSAARVKNVAGKTDMLGFVALLKAAALVIGNDTGGLHLANACGVPVIGLYGPTNPERTRPIYKSAVRIIQPPDCAPSGGGEMQNIVPARVAAAATSMLAQD